MTPHCWLSIVLWLFGLVLLDMSLIRTAVIQPLPGIGDMVWHLPALQALAASAPDGKLTLFTKASSLAPITLVAEPWVADIVYLPKARGIVAIIPNFIRTWWALIRNRPDRLYILHQSARYRLAAKLAGVREIIAYPKTLAKSKVNGWEKSLAFLEQLNIPIPNRYSRLRVNAETVAAAQQKFAAYPQPWFVISSGASETNRCWPEDRFAACADAVVNAFGGTVFLTGAAHEAERITDVHKLCRHAAKVVPSAGLPFDQFMGLVANSAGILGNDSGPINIAAALGKTAFVLCGVSLPGIHSPNLIVIQPDLPVDAGNGMERISTQHVADIMLAHPALAQQVPHLSPQPPELRAASGHE